MTFEIEYARLMKMSKAQIADEMVKRDFVTASSRDYMVKNYAKVFLARQCADKMVREAFRGY